MVGISKRKPGQFVACTQCHIEKPWERGINAFKSGGGKPRQPCSQCDTANRERRRKANIATERVKSKKRMYRWRKNNPEKEREAWLKPRKFDKDLAKKRINQWKREHPETRRIEFHRRKALKLHLPHTFTLRDWEYCLAYWNNQCCICGKQTGNGYVLAQEHWIAISDTRQDNPGTVPWNILPMCHARSGATGGCNNAKWTKDPIVWLNNFLIANEAKEKLTAIMEYFDVVRFPPKERDEA